MQIKIGRTGCGCGICVDMSESGSDNIYNFLPFISFYAHDHIPRPHILKLVKYGWQATAVNTHCKHFVTYHFVYISNLGQNYVHLKSKVWCMCSCAKTKVWLYKYRNMPEMKISKKTTLIKNNGGKENKKTATVHLSFHSRVVFLQIFIPALFL